MTAWRTRPWHGGGRLRRADVARVLEVGRVQVEAQRCRPRAPPQRARPAARARRLSVARGAERQRRAPPSAARRRAPMEAAQVPPTSRTRGPALAQRGRVGVGGRDEPARVEPGEVQDAAAGLGPRGASRRSSRPTNSAAGPPWRARALPHGEARRADVRKPCWAIASPRVRALRRATRTISGRRSWKGCRSGAGITSSVARSTPWSSSQSRISAQRSKVAGSTSCSATAIGAAPRRWSSPRSSRRSASSASKSAVPAWRQRERAPRPRGRGAPRGRRRSRRADRRRRRARTRAPVARASAGARRGRAGDHPRAARRRLERDEPERLVPPGHDDAARAGVGARQARRDRRRRAGSRHAPGDPQRPRARVRSASSAGPVPIEPQRPRDPRERAAASSSRKTPFSRASRPT